MKKILSPVINIVSLILVGIAYGLAGITAAFEVDYKSPVGNYYQLVWQNIRVLNIVGFFLLIAATLFVLLAFLPKGRKVTSLLAGATSIAAGVFALLAPGVVKTGLVLQPGLIGMATLLFVAGFFSLIIFLIEVAVKEEK